MDRENVNNASLIIFMGLKFLLAYSSLRWHPFLWPLSSFPGKSEWNLEAYFQKNLSCFHHHKKKKGNRNRKKERDQAYMGRDK